METMILTCSTNMCKINVISKLLFNNPLTPAICSSLIVSPIAYSIDKAIIKSSLESTPFHKAFIESFQSLKSKDSFMTLFCLISIFFISNIIKKKSNQLIIGTLFLTPIGIFKDIKMCNKNKLQDINILTYYGFSIRDSISLISALLDLGLLFHFLSIIILQLPQTYFHLFGLEYSNKPKYYREKKQIIKKNFLNNVFVRSIKSFIQYGIGMQINKILFSTI
jgi:hypothetical protein